MMTVHAATSETLSASWLLALRAFLDAAFDGHFSDHDWRHAIGGVHVWVSGSDGLISHGSLVERTLVCSGHRLRAGYVEAVATAAANRRHGYGALVMTRVGELVRERYTLGALSTGSHGFYESLGWERWRGPTSVDGAQGPERTPDDDHGVMILRTSRSPHLDLDQAIVCDWREGDVW